jgi:hypothetical protein
MFHSTSQKMMRELDTGSAYRVQFKTSAHHHTLSDMHELVQNHEQELKAHAAVMKQAAERQTQLNAQLQMLYDTRMVTRVTESEAEFEQLLQQHKNDEIKHSAKLKKAQERQVALDAYGNHLQVAAESDQQHRAAQAAHAEAVRAAQELQQHSKQMEAEHIKNMQDLVRLKNASTTDKARAAAINNNPIAHTFVNTVSGRQQSRTTR